MLEHLAWRSFSLSYRRRPGEGSRGSITTTAVKLNGCVERAHRTHREEFYEVVDSDLTVADLRPKLLQWERVYNPSREGRPHQALGYLTPQQFLERYKQH